jgi:hypothetical protein
MTESCSLANKHWKLINRTSKAQRFCKAAASLHPIELLSPVPPPERRQDRVHGLKRQCLAELTVLESWLFLFVGCRPFARQRPRNKQRDNSRCYAMIVRWAIILDSFLGNGSLNTFPRQRLQIKRGKLGVSSAVRAEDLKNRTGATNSVDSWHSVPYWNLEGRT